MPQLHPSVGGTWSGDLAQVATYSSPVTQGSFIPGAPQQAPELCPQVWSHSPNPYARDTIDVVRHLYHQAGTLSRRFGEAGSLTGSRGGSRRGWGRGSTLMRLLGFPIGAIYSSFSGDLAW